MSTAPPEINPAKVRIGLGIVAVLFAASVVLMIVVDDPIGRAIFVGVAVLALVRMALLARWLRREGPSRNGDAATD